MAERTTASIKEAFASVAEELPTKALARAELLATIALFEKEPERLADKELRDMLLAGWKEYLTTDEAFDEQVKQLVGTRNA